MASRVPLGLRWPKPTHGDGLRPLVTVRDTLGLPLDRPSVTVTATENRACNVSGARGGELQVAVGVRGARRAGDLLKPMLRARGEVYEPRHAALLQGFPPDFQFHGARSSVWRQIGNAVPPPLGEIVGRMILEAIE